MSKRSAIDPYFEPVCIGIDVSAHQGDINWPMVADAEAVFKGQSQGPIEYAIVRSSDGVQTRRHSKPDPYAVRNLQRAHEARLPTAVYHYVRAYHGAEEQAELILDVVRTAAVPIAFIALDVEGRPDHARTRDVDESDGAWWHPGNSNPPTTDEVLDVLTRMTRYIADRGYRVLIYTGVAWHWYIAQRRIEVPIELASLELWTPYYTTGKRPRMPISGEEQPWPWAEWRFWQFAGSQQLPGKVAGINGIVDLNRFRGDSEALREWWNPKPPAVPVFERQKILDLAAEAGRFGDVDAKHELEHAYDHLLDGCRD
jgi:GH25 family lysozyme M1 (1,4-beta-N-acetylmuramidase)